MALRSLCLLLLLGLSQTALTSPAPPTLYEASYSASYNGLAIDNLRTLKHEGESYVLTTNASNFLGTIREEEQFQIDANGNILPQAYSYERNILGSARREDTVFDPAKSRVHNSYKGENVDLAMTAQLLAPLSYQMRMRADLLAGMRELHYPVVTRRKIRDYHYQVTGREMLSTPLGKLDTVVIKRMRADNERQTLLWLAPSLDYVPVKLLQKEDGESYEMLIATYKALPRPAGKAVQ